MQAARCALGALALAAAVGVATAQPQQYPGDSLQLYWCDGSDPTQMFSLQADGTVRTTGGALCVANVNNETIELAKCEPTAATQQWAYRGYMMQQGNYCWNMQSSQSYMYPNASVKLWTCQPPNWNDCFTLGSPSPSTILANFTSAGNTSFTNLCVQSLHFAPPMPTPDVLAWQENPVGCFIHYNMATAAGTQGCGGGSPPPPISTWAPTALDTDAWISTCKAMGGTRAVYVAKHGCGFTAWKSNVTLYNYSYSVKNSAYPDVDVVASFVASAQKAGLGYGFYYSVVSNAYCNVNNGVVQPGPINPSLQLNLTQAQYEEIILAHLRELYTAYGALTEIWFDGGYQRDMQAELQALLSELQPHVVAFQAEGLVASPVRWVGSESGLAPYPCWSTCAYDDYGAGDPGAGTWFPAETDFTLQNGDNWFYNPTAGVHSPSELRNMYETSVGSNTALIIDIAPYPNGTVPPEQVQAAATLGGYTKACYGGQATVAQAGPVDGWTIALPVPGSTGSGASIDRVVFGEDQGKAGQRVRAYTVTAIAAGSGANITLGSGSSVGARRIHVLPSPVAVTAVTLTITASSPGPTGDNTPHLSGLALLSCSSLAEQADAEWEEWARSAGYAQPQQAVGEGEGDGKQQPYVRLWAQRAA